MALCFTVVQDNFIGCGCDLIVVDCMCMAQAQELIDAQAQAASQVEEARRLADQDAAEEKELAAEKREAAKAEAAKLKAEDQAVKEAAKVEMAQRKAAEAAVKLQAKEQAATLKAKEQAEDQAAKEAAKVEMAQRKAAEAAAKLQTKAQATKLKAKEQAEIQAGMQAMKLAKTYRRFRVKIEDNAAVPGLEPKTIETEEEPLKHTTNVPLYNSTSLGDPAHTTLAAEEIISARGPVHDDDAREWMQTRQGMWLPYFASQCYLELIIGDGKGADMPTSMANRSVTGVWVPDKEASACFECATPFKLKVRRHHCRHCGHVFCKRCSDFKAQLKDFEGPQRVCTRCLVMLEGAVADTHEVAESLDDAAEAAECATDEAESRPSFEELPQTSAKALRSFALKQGYLCVACANSFPPVHFPSEPSRVALSVEPRAVPLCASCPLWPHSNKEGKHNKSFKKRWFVLMDLDAKPDGSYALLYYDDEARRLPAARPCLRACPRC